MQMWNAVLRHAVVAAALLGGLGEFALLLASPPAWSPNVTRP